jgi:transcriptional regulator with XRE-family HTH domain
MKTKNVVDPWPGRRLCEIRAHRGISQARLARSLRVTVGTIQNYEHGRVHITAERLEQLAHALQCELADLLARPGSAMPRYRSWRRAAALLHRRQWVRVFHPDAFRER